MPSNRLTQAYSFFLDLAVLSNKLTTSSPADIQKLIDTRKALHNHVK